MAPNMCIFNFKNYAVANENNVLVWLHDTITIRSPNKWHESVRVALYWPRRAISEDDSKNNGPRCYTPSNPAEATFELELFELYSLWLMFQDFLFCPRVSIRWPEVLSQLETVLCLLGRDNGSHLLCLKLHSNSTSALCFPKSWWLYNVVLVADNFENT